MCHLDLKAVAVGKHLIEIDRLQGATAEAFVATRRIRERHAGDDLHVKRRAHAQHQATERPVDHTDAVGVAGTENQVRVFRRFEKLWDVIRIVRKIAVHLHDELISVLERPFEAGDIGAAESVLLLPMQDVDG